MLCLLLYFLLLYVCISYTFFVFLFLIFPMSMSLSLFTTRPNSSFVSPLARSFSLSLLYTSIKVCIFISQLCLLFPLLFTFSLTSPSPFLTFAFPLLTSTQVRPSVEFQLIFNLNWRLHHSTTVNINYNGSTQAGTAHCCSIHHFKSGVCVFC